ncbi:MAG: hypothetical protein K5662_06090 [Lachnospiraceae bacterium]|nr:hypothetical protein [Lachnospiraceae bacterium]
MKKWNKRGVGEIDLTPLLDVIFIVLMVVMCQQSLSAQTTQEEIDKLTTELEEAVDDSEFYKDQLGNYENADQLVAYVTLYADYETDDPATRHVRLAYNSDIAFEEIEITPEKEETAYGDIKDELVAFLTDHKEIPVLITLNENRILYRDQKKMTALFDELDEEYENFYVSGKQEE